MIDLGMDMSKKDTEQQNQDNMHEEHVDVGAYIIALRESVGWTQADLIRHTGIDKGLVSRYESNQRKVSDENFVKIQRAVMAEKDRRLHDGSFTDPQGQYFYDQYIVGMLREMNHLGMSEARMEGVRESISGIIKSALAN